MKKVYIFLSIVIVIIFLIFIVKMKEQKKIDDKYLELNKKSITEMKKYSYEDIIENIYIENSAFPIMSRHITAEEVYDILPYNNVEK